MTVPSVPLLDVAGVRVTFGGIVALDGVSFAVQRGSIAGLIGPNGAGKTTLFNCISRIYQVDSGTIHVDGKPVLDMPIHRICQVGLGRTFQNLALFGKLSVLDNVMIGAHARTAGNFVADALRLVGVGRRAVWLRNGLDGRGVGLRRRTRCAPRTKRITLNRPAGRASASSIPATLRGSRMAVSALKVRAGLAQQSAEPGERADPRC